MFKLNDIVVVLTSGVYFGKRRLATVTKVTKTGQFETSITGTTKFNADGSERGRSKWGGFRICPASAEDIQQINDSVEHDNLLYQIEQVKMKSLTKNQLERILAITKEEK